jgi:hypothetical protein
MRGNENLTGKIKPTLGISRCFPLRRRIFFFPESDENRETTMDASIMDGVTTNYHVL